MARQRPQYASDAQVRRIARLAAELGIDAAALHVGGDGSVLIIGASRSPAHGTTDEAEEALETWEAEQKIRRPPSAR